MYGVLPYFVAKVAMDTPVLLLSPFVAANIMYWAVGFEYTFVQFIKYYLALAMTAQAAASLGYLLSSAFEAEAVALALAPLCVMPMILFGGLMSNNASAVDWLAWIQYISPIKYCAEASMWNEFSNDPYGVRDPMMEFIDYKLGYWTCMLIFLGCIVVFRLIAFMCFKRLVRKFQ